MSELIIYASILLLSMVLFYVWYRRQGQASEKQWLLQQINQSNGPEQQQYVDALNQLNNSAPSNMKVTLWIGLMIIPATLAIDYIWFHDIPIDQRFAQTSGSSDGSQTPDLATAIQQLEQKLADDPDNLEGQLLYGLTMMSTQNYAAAVDAYKKANQLDPNNADILTELAESIAFKNNTGSFLGEPEQYLSQAIAINPKQQKAMWLQGIVLFENLDYQQAESIWTDLLSMVDSPNIQATIRKQINQARQAQNKPNLDTAPATSQAQAASPEGYLVVITADEAVKNLPLDPSARIFVYAKQVNGPPMPVAAVPISQPFNWPISVRINDANSLTAERKLSQFDQLEFSAKLSMSGNASPAADDVSSDLKVAGKQTKNIQLKLIQ